VSDLELPVPPTPRVMLVDVRPERRNVMRSMIDLAIGTGTVVAQVASSVEALAAVERHQVNTAIIEVQMPLGEGVAAIVALRAAHPELLILVCTFDGSRAIRQQAIEAGADSYLLKPISVRELRDVLSAGRPTRQTVASAP
jgi:DNA-binding NarL/FixJ family response regulator